MKNTRPVVSVIIAAFDAEKTLSRAIESLERQTMKLWEAIIVDDASSDGTWGVACELAALDSRIRPFRLKDNSGPSGARNFALSKATGEWVAILDADDAFFPTRLSTLCELSRNGQYDLIFDNLAKLTHSNVVSTPFWPEWSAKPTRIERSELLLGLTGLMSTSYGYLKPFINKEFLLKKGLKYDEALRRAEDVDFYYRLILNGARIGRVVEAGYFYDVPTLNNKVSASTKNITQSYDVTVKMIRQSWRILNFREKLWLLIRLHKFSNPPNWNDYLDLRREKRFLATFVFVFRHPSVLKKIVFWRLPSAIFKRHIMW